MVRGHRQGMEESACRGGGAKRGATKEGRIGRGRKKSRKNSLGGGINRKEDAADKRQERESE